MNHKITQVGDITIHYVEAGPADGPLVVLLHGFPEFWYSWRNQIPALAAAGFHVVAPDLRGYNESSRPQDSDAYRLTEIIKDISGLIVQLGGKCTLVGHDWGGITAWFLTMTHPDLIERLIVLNAPHPVPFSRELTRSTSQKLRAAYQLFFALPVLPEIFLRLFLRPFMKRVGKFTESEVDQYDVTWRVPGARTAMLNYYRAMKKHRASLRTLIRPINAPTMLIWGEGDPVFTIATTRDFGEYVPNLRLERIKAAGHFVQTDAAERVTSLMLEFLPARTSSVVQSAEP